jgi:hypothetical protein
VRYLVVGGYAVAIHGHPRYTKDIEVWIEPDRDNASRTIAALAQFGLASLELVAEDFLEPDRIIQLGYPPARIDLLTSVPGVDFAECYPARVQATFDDVVVDFIDLANLKLAKRAAGRPQDVADLAELGG